MRNAAIPALLLSIVLVSGCGDEGTAAPAGPTAVSSTVGAEPSASSSSAAVPPAAAIGLVARYGCGPTDAAMVLVEVARPPEGTLSAEVRHRDALLGSSAGAEAAVGAPLSVSIDLRMTEEAWEAGEATVTLYRTDEGRREELGQVVTALRLPQGTACG